MNQHSLWPRTFTIVPIVAWLITATAASAQLFPLSHTFDDPTPNPYGDTSPNGDFGLGDRFGTSVALDGNRVLIGAPRHESSGQVHLFDAISGDLVQTFDDPTITDGDGFGTIVALDGNRVLIGAPGDDLRGVTNIGQAYLFDTTGNLLQTFDDPNAITDEAQAGHHAFGTSLALDGDHVLIGHLGDDTSGVDAGQAYLFDAVTGNLLHTLDVPNPSGEDWFGRSVALDGGSILIGAPNLNAKAGQAHLFDATTGNLVRTFDDPSPNPGERFGWVVALDGNRVLVSAHLKNSNGGRVLQAHLFDVTTGALLQTFDDPTPTTTEGPDRISIANDWLALDGNRVLMGASLEDAHGENVGQAHVFDATTGALLQTFDDPTPTSVPYDWDFAVGDRFGNSVALDGSRILIGAPGDHTNGMMVGQAYLFEIAGGAGDFNADGEVDGEDFLWWQRGESPNPLITSDLTEWKANFGLSTGSGLRQVSVPEPTTWIIMWGVMVGAFACRTPRAEFGPLRHGSSYQASQYECHSNCSTAHLDRSLRLARIMNHFFATASVLIVLAHPARAVVTSDEFGSHVVTPGRPIFGLDLDGVVIQGYLAASGDPLRFCTGALISDRHVLTAAHCLDADGDGQVDPFLGALKHEQVFELADGWVAIEYELDSIQFPAQWPDSRGDLAVVTLVADAPPGVPRYPLYGASDEVGQTAVIVGYGAPGHGATGRTGGPLAKRAGLNRYEAIRDDYSGVDFLAYDFDSGRPENNALELFGIKSDLGFGGDEVVSALGDSGGPTFINGAIAGVTAFTERLKEADVTDELDASWGDVAFDTRVSTFREFIMEATAGAAVFVPEPSNEMLAVCGWFTFCGVQHRRRSADC